VQSVHRRLFEDIYSWAGELRTVHIVKGNVPFARVHHLRTAVEEVFAGPGQLPAWPRCAGFRERSGAAACGYQCSASLSGRQRGRAQRVFLQPVANDADYQLRWADTDPAENIAVSEAAMADPDAFAPLILGILVLLTARLSPTELRLARDDPPDVGL
jgi:cell filamentation protein